MLITFKSSAAADVLMYKMHAKPLLDVLGKNVDQGIITAEEMPDAVARLEEEVALSKQRPASQDNDDNPKTEEEDLESGKKVSFAARAFPLLEMMRSAKQENTFVMWRV